MANTYYSGQGSFLIGDRIFRAGNPIAQCGGLTALGNVSALSIDIETTKFEHKESESGNRAVDLSIIQEKKGTFTMTLENVNGFNLALALWGNTGSVAVTPVVDYVVKVDVMDVPYPLPVPNIASIQNVDDGVGAGTAYTEESAPGVGDNDYGIDLINGTITFFTGGTVVVTDEVYIDYTPAASTTVVEAFTETSQERWLRFNGLNTVSDSNVVVDAFKASFDPMTGYGLINEEIAQLELTGNLLLDDTQPSNDGTTSQFFRQFLFDAA
jgi:hypothetical protein